MTAATTAEVAEKIAEVQEELRRLAFAGEGVPAWVQHYQLLPVELAFCEWLQFVFLPNKLYGGRHAEFGNVAPQAVRFFGEGVGKGHLLQLLVELDALT